MQVGYNTNIPYKGKVYHVQTEDTGIESYQIISLLYYKGAILHSRKSTYEELKDDPGLKEKVREMMKEQHKVLCKELIAGKHTPEGGAAEPVAEEAPAAAPSESQVVKEEQVVAAPVEAEPAAAEAVAVQEISEEELLRPKTDVVVEPDPITTEEKRALEKEARNLDDILIDFIMSQAGKK